MLVSWICIILMQYLHPLIQLCLRLIKRRLEVVSLPIEILAQVFMHLDFPSVHAVRLTSRTFYSVTKTRQFWYNRINKLTKTYHVSPPEDKFDNYTVDELEQWILRRSRAFNVFVNSEQPHFHKRTFDLRPEGLSDLDPRDFKLLPGGRWLLVSHPSAVLHFLDLDCPDPTPRLLFDPKEIDNQIHEPKDIRFSIWIDRGAPQLSFRLAFFVEAEDLSRTYIIRVDLAGHGMEATLISTNIAMLRNFNLDLWSAGTALNDRYLVQVWGEGPRKVQIGVYDYRQALGRPDYPMNHESNGFPDVTAPGMMEFICNDILAFQCLRSRSLLIFEVGPSTPLILLHRIDMDSYPWSMPRWTPRATFATMVHHDSREIQGLVIPHDPSRPPTIVTLGRCNKRKTCRYTLGTWVLVAHDNPHKVFSHDWDFNPPVDLPPSLTCRFEEDLTTDLLTFDEDTGRFLGYHGRWYLVIYDMI